MLVFHAKKNLDSYIVEAASHPLEADKISYRNSYKLSG